MFNRQFSRRNTSKLTSINSFNHPQPDLPSSSSNSKPNSRIENEILISQQEDYIFDYEDEQVFCSMSSEKTGSSCSFSEDPSEKDAIEKVKGMLNEVDNLLYDPESKTSLNENIKEECKEWSNRYPLFRVVGKQLQGPTPKSKTPISSFEYTPVMNRTDSHSPFERENLFVKGKSIKALQPSFESTNNAVDFIEEELCTEGVYEDYIASDNAKKTDNLLLLDSIKPKSPSNIKNLSSDNLKFLRDKVLSKLMEKVWPEVLASHFPKTEIKRIDSSKRKLPDLSTPLRSLSISKGESSSRPATGISLSRPHTNLDGILTISSKTLLDRKETKKNADHFSYSRPLSTVTSRYSGGNFSRHLQSNFNESQNYGSESTWLNPRMNQDLLLPHLIPSAGINSNAHNNPTRNGMLPLGHFLPPIHSHERKEGVSAPIKSRTKRPFNRPEANPQSSSGYRVNTSYTAPHSKEFIMSPSQSRDGPDSTKWSASRNLSRPSTRSSYTPKM